jgi:integrase
LKKADSEAEASQARRHPKAKRARPPRPRYDTNSYRRAITYGIQQANKQRDQDNPEIPAWYPLQIRHSRATEVRRLYGLDGAQSALGHKNADITQVYAEKSLKLAIDIARSIG